MSYGYMQCGPNLNQKGINEVTQDIRQLHMYYSSVQASERLYLSVAVSQEKEQVLSLC